MGAFDIVKFGLMMAFFLGAMVFFGRSKNSSEDENSKQTFENSKSEALFIVYLTLGVFGVIAVGVMLFGD